MLVTTTMQQVGQSTVSCFSVGSHCTRQQVASLWHHWHGLMQNRGGLWLIDLSELRHYDTAGLQLVQALTQQAERAGASVCFKAPRELTLPYWAMAILSQQWWHEPQLERA